MKFILTLLAIILFASSTFAQQYSDASLVPDLVKKGLKGNVKAVITVTYIAKPNGEPIPDSLESIQIDSFDTHGFIMYEQNVTDNTITRYYYTNGKLSHKIYFKKNKKDTYYSVIWQGPYKYSFIGHDYDAKGINYSPKEAFRETHILNKEQQEDTLHNESPTGAFGMYTQLDAAKKAKDVYMSFDGVDYFPSYKDVFLKPDEYGNLLGIVRITTPALADKIEAVLIKNKYYE